MHRRQHWPIRDYQQDVFAFMHDRHQNSMPSILENAKFVFPNAGPRQEDYRTPIEHGEHQLQLYSIITTIIQLFQLTITKYLEEQEKEHLYWFTQNTSNSYCFSVISAHCIVQGIVGVVSYKYDIGIHITTDSI